VTDVCDCSARGTGARWLDMKETTAHTGAGDVPALIVRDSTAATATGMVSMARYSTATVGISRRYTPGGGLYYSLLDA